MRLKLTLLLCLALLTSCNREHHQQFQGYVEGETIFLASPYSGILSTLAIRRGQQVEKGQLLFKLDPKPQDYSIAQLSAEYEQAKNTLLDLQKPKRKQEIEAIEAQIEQTNAAITLAELRVSRFQKLFDKKASDKDTLDAAVANLKQHQDLKLQYEANLSLAKIGSREEQIKAQQAQVAAVQARLEAAQWELKQKTVTAPASGIIFDTYYRQGEFVPNQQAVVSLLTPQNVRIEFFVPLEFLTKIQPGQSITFDCLGCDQNNKATISYISPEAEFLPPLVYSKDNASKLVFRLKAQIEEPSRFKPGQPVRVFL